MSAKAGGSREPSRSAVYTLAALLAAGAAAGIGAAAAAARHTGERWSTAEPSVDDIVRAPALRVWGAEALGSMLDVAARPAWMSEAVAVPTAIWRDGRVRMYFGGVEATGDTYVSRVRIGLAQSDDGSHFRIANGGRPVMGEGPPEAFDSHSVSHPFVLPVGAELWMYYAGADGTKGAGGARVERLGLARSGDGVTWRRDPRPVLDLGGPADIDSTQVASPCVLQRGDAFQLWYGAYDGRHRIAYATSADGSHWTKHGAVSGLRGAERGELGPSVYFDGRRYLMFYNSVDPEAQEWKLYGATSADGMTWQPAYAGRPVVDEAPESSFAAAGRGRNSAVHPSQLLVVRGRLMAYYMGEDREGVQRIGAILFPKP